MRGLFRILILVALWIFIIPPATPQAEALWLATYDAGLSAKGPGLLLRDIASAGSPRLMATLAHLSQVSLDILLLGGFDYDYYLTALSGLRDRLQARGLDYPFVFAKRPNAGMATHLDLDGDGRKRGARDAQGFGQFAGAGGLAILSNFHCF